MTVIVSRSSRSTDEIKAADVWPMFHKCWLHPEVHKFQRVNSRGQTGNSQSAGLCGLWGFRLHHMYCSPQCFSAQLNLRAEFGFEQKWSLFAFLSVSHLSAWIRYLVKRQSAVPTSRAALRRAHIANRRGMKKQNQCDTKPMRDFPMSR